MVAMVPGVSHGGDGFRLAIGPGTSHGGDTATMMASWDRRPRMIANAQERPARKIIRARGSPAKATTVVVKLPLFQQEEIMALIDWSKRNDRRH